MAKKAENTSISLEPIKKTVVTAKIIGTSDLILNTKCRSYELPEIFKQTHPKGTKMPAKYAQAYNLWEHLITSLHWRDPITFHDDDWSLYSEEEWEYYMKNNAPCFKAYAMLGSMRQAFITFGFKDSTGKNGTDMDRALSMSSDKYPITFERVGYEQKLIPSKAKGNPNVVGTFNIFSGWGATVQFICPDIFLPEESLISLLATTGEFVGIGTQRKNGYGRFEVVSVECEKK